MVTQLIASIEKMADAIRGAENQPGKPRTALWHQPNLLFLLRLFVGNSNDVPEFWLFIFFTFHPVERLYKIFEINSDAF